MNENISAEVPRHRDENVCAEPRCFRDEEGDCCVEGRGLLPKQCNRILNHVEALGNASVWFWACLNIAVSLQGVVEVLLFLLLLFIWLVC
jgi:hypothetical protein